MIAVVKSLVRQCLYELGFYSLAHRVRNRNTLTVFMFHRVLPPGSTAFHRAEREFTMSVAGFAACLDFIKLHYNVVPHTAIKSHLLNGELLPPRAALITFDDGWRDTLLYALPELKKRSLQGVLFVATQVTELAEDRWWQDMLVEALVAPDNLALLEAELDLAIAQDATRPARLRRLTSALAEADVSRRHALLEKFVPSSTDSRQMLTEVDLHKLAPAISIAGHGHTHGPLSDLRDLQADLNACAAKLRQINGDYWAISFPHGAQDVNTLPAASQAGFQVCYSSEPSMVDTLANKRVNAPLGRIHIPENEWTCDGGQMSNAKLATFLFFRAIL